jgi:hypothetical protein
MVAIRFGKSETKKAKVMRIISARRAGRKERTRYDENRAKETFRSAQIPKLTARTSLRLQTNSSEALFKVHSAAQ